MISIKKTLHQLCRAYVQDRIDRIQEAIQQLHLSSATETKSSAGDKYETGRSMMQLEMEQSNQQLAGALQEMNVLERIPVDRNTYRKAEVGSIVLTTEGNFYIAISAGLLIHNKIKYVAISSASPIGQRLIGLSKGDSFSFNRREYRIVDIG